MARMVTCDKCGKVMRWTGLAMHVNAKHGASSTPPSAPPKSSSSPAPDLTPKTVPKPAPAIKRRAASVERAAPVESVEREAPEHRPSSDNLWDDL